MWYSTTKPSWLSRHDVVFLWFWWVRLYSAVVIFAIWDTSYNVWQICQINFVRFVCSIQSAQFWGCSFFFLFLVIFENCQLSTLCLCLLSFPAFFLPHIWSDCWEWELVTRQPTEVQNCYQGQLWNLFVVGRFVLITVTWTCCSLVWQYFGHHRW